MKKHLSLILMCIGVVLVFISAWGFWIWYLMLNGQATF